ncbi:M14 family zinc carboxypeptidase [Paractinoplanes atraurantiacus]|uniref:Zinc carboxypeptidase n=1 Tax=Paractinoplanes atraurantiacus TaxID=1036182 RepID=A0A285JL72_9ACTN|nr:M14 family zinc carboxypeptidase [Actinoplanes atraurantiacus]SNY61025.1 Zinc carboxypeptidase [Actinoplanes atraurantiacus]
MRKKLATILSAALLGGALWSVPGTAQAAAGERAPLVSARPSPAEVQRALTKIARASDGRVRLGVIGRSNEGRALRLASVGHGPTRLLFVTQQHGDEPLGTPAAIRALWTLGVPDTPWQRALLKRVTLDVVVQANPDGAVREQRYNHDPSASGDYSESGVGYDINRFHNPLTPIEENPVPESRAVLRLWHASHPKVVVDYHMQGRYLQPDGRETTASILWPTSPLAGDVTKSRQVAVRNYDAMTKLAGANVTRYPGGEYEGIARNAYGILGSASLLVELSDLPYDQIEFQIRTAYTSMLATVQGAADGSLWRADPARADAIPARGPALPGVTAESLDAAA